MKKVLNFCIIFLVCAAMALAVTICVSMYGLSRESSEFEALNKVVLPTETIQNQPISAQKTLKSNAMLKGVEELHKENDHLAGFICVPGTDINYPVMHTPKEPEYYLRKSFSKKYSHSGTPFADARCTFAPLSDNIIIYGHNMHNGTMFSDLLEYENQDFCKLNGQIKLCTLEKELTYDIIAVVHTEVYNDKVFDCYSMINAEDDNEFEAYVDGLKQASLYDTGVSAEYGDSLITLSTCVNNSKRGRFVIVGKHTPEKE